MSNHDDDCPPMQNKSPQVLVSRRALLAAGAAALAGFGSEWPVLADDIPPEDAHSTFLAVSRAATGYPDLSGLTSGRIYEALQSADATLPDSIAKLGQIAQGSPDPETFKNAATAIHLDALLMTIITAWYTGTVTGSKGPVVVAYAEALMYRPVADGLTVPTYCNRGPIWWSGLPPEITSMPQNSPKVL